jgi:hypothetical protein
LKENDQVDGKLLQSEVATPVAKRQSVLKNYYALKTCFMYTLLGVTFVLFDEAWPLWSMADVSAGGLGFSTDNIGITNAGWQQTEFHLTLM